MVIALEEAGALSLGPSAIWLIDCVHTSRPASSLEDLRVDRESKLAERSFEGLSDLKGRPTGV